MAPTAWCTQLTPRGSRSLWDCCILTDKQDLLVLWAGLGWAEKPKPAYTKENGLFQSVLCGFCVNSMDIAGAEANTQPLSPNPGEASLAG